MTLKTTTIAIDSVVLLGIFVGVEWLAHVFTDTRNMFAPAVLILGIYVVLRIVISARKARHAGDTPHST
jgi:hypothetical protein